MKSKQGASCFRIPEILARTVDDPRHVVTHTHIAKLSTILLLLLSLLLQSSIYLSFFYFCSCLSPSPSTPPPPTTHPPPKPPPLPSPSPAHPPRRAILRLLPRKLHPWISIDKVGISGKPASITLRLSPSRHHLRPHYIRVLSL